MGTENFGTLRSLHINFSALWNKQNGDMPRNTHLLHHTLSDPEFFICGNTYTNLLVMNEMKLKRASFWSADHQPLPMILTLKRGKNRTRILKELLIEVLQNVAPQKPTAKQLCKLAHIRRKTFIWLLKSMVEDGTIIRHGTGLKGDPYRFSA